MRARAVNVEHSSRKRVMSVLMPVAALAVFSAVPASAYDRYNDGCQVCHGAFTDGTSTKGTVFPNDDKHRMHRDSAYMDTHCDLCHTSGDNRNPWLGSSDGRPGVAGVGCVGCHGRDYGGGTGVSGVGLRAHHAANGVTFCAGCHASDPAPLSESVSPPYYGTTETLADDSCNSAPDYLENWSIGDTIGLDNDGDDVYDGADADCGVSSCPQPGASSRYCEADIFPNNGDGNWNYTDDGDCIVNILDLGELLGNFGVAGSWTREDGDVYPTGGGGGDGAVDILDLGELLAQYSNDCN